MGQLLGQHTGFSVLGFAAYFATLWIGLGFIVSVLGGWRGLAERYRTTKPFPAHKRRMQSAQMRWGTGYRGVLMLASDRDGMYLGVLPLFRVGHPRLFIPWSEIDVGEPRRYFFVNMQKLGLGPERTTLRLRTRTVQFLLEPLEN